MYMLALRKEEGGIFVDVFAKIRDRGNLVKQHHEFYSFLFSDLN